MTEQQLLHVVRQVAFLEKVADITSQDSTMPSSPAISTPSRGNADGDGPEPAPGTVRNRYSRRELMRFLKTSQAEANSLPSTPPAQPTPPPPAPGNATTNTGGQGGPVTPPLLPETENYLQALGSRLGGTLRRGAESALGGVAWPFAGAKDQQLWGTPSQYGHYLSLYPEEWASPHPPAQPPAMSPPLETAPRTPSRLQQMGDRASTLPGLMSMLGLS